MWCGVLVCLFAPAWLSVAGAQQPLAAIQAEAGIFPVAEDIPRQEQAERYRDLKLKIEGEVDYWEGFCRMTGCSVYQKMRPLYDVLPPPGRKAWIEVMKERGYLKD